MSGRIFTLYLSRFTFEQVEEAFYELTRSPQSSALLSDLSVDLLDELEARAQVRNADKTR